MTRRLSRALAAGLAAGMIVMGAGLAALPLVRQLEGEWRQHDLAVAGDGTIPRYRNAVDAAYAVVVSDFEDSLVAFEVGALPTTVDGRVLAPNPARSAGAPPPTRAPPADPAPATSVAPPPAPVFTGAVIRIPRIGVNQAVVDGVSRSHLRRGPGHYPGTAVPGYTGNSVISGHRTTYSRPFHDLDLLEPGDAIVVDTAAGSHRYVVERIFVVSPDDLSPLAATDRAVLTLTTCTPKGSADSRLIVVGVLDGAPLDAAA